MKFLFNYKIITARICRTTVMFKVFIHHFVCYISRTPGSISNSPKMPTPILFPKRRKLFLNTTRSSAFQPLHNVTYRDGWGIFNVNMNVIFAHYTFQYFDIFRFTYLAYQFSTSFLNISFQNIIAIFCNPYYMSCQPRNSMASKSLLFTHELNLLKCVATKVLH